MKKIEIVSVGEELLSGSVVDTNAAWLSRILKEMGISVPFRQTCGDKREDILSSLQLAVSRADLVLVTGGLGPTHDDITRQVTAELFGAELKEDAEVVELLRAYFARRGMKMPQSNLLQAQVPEGALVLKNDWGTAPGLWLRGDVGSVVLLPGVPSEMKAIFQHRVLPSIREWSGVATNTCILRFYGISESLLDETIQVLEDPDGKTVIAPYAGKGEVELHVTATGETEEEARKKCEETKEKILSLVGEFCYGEGDTCLENELVKKCLEKKISLATAESCTGGLLSQRITSVSGSSQVFSLGICTYSEEEKVKRLGVPQEVLSKYGVYSRECALCMAKGIRALSGASLGIGITGIAGPTGGTETDPVGTVYIAVVTEEREEVLRTVFGMKGTSREFIRHLASSKALSMALSQVKEKETRK